MAHPLLMSALQDGGVELREGELRAKGRKRKEGGEERRGEGRGGEAACCSYIENLLVLHKPSACAWMEHS